MSTGGCGKGAHIIGFQIKLTMTGHWNTFKEADLDFLAKASVFKESSRGGSSLI